MTDTILDKPGGPGGRIAPSIGRHWTEAEIGTCLLTLAHCHGNAKEAHRRLKAAGINISYQTLTNWRRGPYAREYLEQRAHHTTQIDRETADSYREVTQLALQGTRLGIENTITQLKAGTIKDTSTAARNLNVISGISTDKALLLEGRPTSITEQRTGTEILRTLEELGHAQGFINGTATEETSESPALGPAGPV